MAQKRSEIKPGFSTGTLGINVCDLKSEEIIPQLGSEIFSGIDVQELNSVFNTARNKRTSFKIPVTLWVYNRKAQTEALVDSGATANFIDRDFAEKKNLTTTRLRNPIEVKNVDGTLNKTSMITEYVRCYLGIGSHKSTQYLYVTGLGNKDVILGYSYLYEHNPMIDWKKGEWEFTRCPENCKSDRARKINSLEAGTEEPQEDEDLNEEAQWEAALEEMGEADELNPHINWVDIDNL